MNLFKFPFSFVAGTKAKAEEVNANFGAAEDEINDNLRPGLFTAGDLKATARSAAPDGWLMCEGQAVNRATYKSLFEAIGTTYGKGDGGTTFNVPDLRGRVPVGVDGAAGRLSANDALGNAGGEEKHQLAEGEMPAHHHFNNFNSSANGSDHTHQSAGWSGTRHEGTGAAYPNMNSGANSVTTGESGSHVHAVTGDTDTRGSSQAHNNMQPFQVVSWMVKT
jgi:microcystin-dependent protein